MTTTIEKEFFKAFEIKPEENQYCNWECRIPELEHIACHKICKYQKYECTYPEITDNILLKLICIIPRSSLYGCGTINQMKEATLKDLTYTMQKYNAEELKKQVQFIFRD